MTEQALDKLIKRAMLDAARQEYGNLMEDLPEHTFSPVFERKMKKLVRRGNHPLRYKILHAAACLLLVLLLSGCSILAFSAEAREAFVGWVREVYETSFIYRFSGSDQVTPPSVLYRPTYIPDGYRMTSESVTDGGAQRISYRNDFGFLGHFTCFPADSSPVFHIERDGSETYQRVLVNGNPAELYLDQDEDEASILLWKDRDEGTIFCVSAQVSETELIKMAESIEAVPVGYRLDWVPEGFELFDSDSKMPIMITYYRENGDMLELRISISTDSLQVQVGVTEADTYKRVSISGRPGDLYLDASGENSILVWMDGEGEQDLVFMLNGPLSEEEMMKVAENVQRTAFPPPPPHCPSWLPEGYRQTGRSSGYTQLEKRYSKDSGEKILFGYGEDGLADEVKMKLENLIPQTVLVSGHSAWLYIDADGTRHLVWSGDKPESYYWLTGPLSKEELIQIAESVGQEQGWPANDEDVQ